MKNEIVLMGDQQSGRTTAAVRILDSYMRDQFAGALLVLRNNDTFRDMCHRFPTVVGHRARTGLMYFDRVGDREIPPETGLVIVDDFNAMSPSEKNKLAALWYRHVGRNPHARIITVP